MLFLLGFVLGLFVGGMFGLLAAGLCWAARWEDEIKKMPDLWP